jgi:hypothetical protein
MLAVVPDSMTTPQGESIHPMGWTGQYRILRKLIDSGARLAIERFDGVEWISDPVAWWAAHGGQVRTDDHEPQQEWPADAYYEPSVWRSSLGRVLVVQENC